MTTKSFFERPLQDNDFELDIIARQRATIEMQRIIIEKLLAAIREHIDRDGEPLRHEELWSVYLSVSSASTITGASEK